MGIKQGLHVLSYHILKCVCKPWWLWNQQFWRCQLLWWL